jgi:hypothetical protein
MKITLAALLVASCAASSVGQGQAASHAFTISISAERPVVKAGSDVSIRVQMTNTSKHIIDCTMAPSNVTGADRKYRYEVRDDTGKPLNAVRIDTIHESGSIWPCTFKPGESTAPSDNMISRLYDLRRSGEYVIQVSRDDPKEGLVKSNTITVTVTDDDRVIERATPPFTLRIDAYSAGTAADHLVVKAGAEVGIDIVKTNTSKHEEDCVIIHNNMTGLDDKYQFDVRDSSGNPVDKRRIERPEPFIMPPSSCTLKPGESQASGGNTITRLYNLSRPGNYTIQVSQPVPDNPEDGVVKSNTITVTVTE